MSHITDVKLLVKDLDGLRLAADVLGFEFVEGKRTYNWYGRFMNDSDEGKRVVAERGVESLGKCDHVLRVKGAPATDYEIGVVRNADETYSLLFDTWGTGQKLVARAGVNLARLRQEYAVAVTTKRVEKTMARQGFRMTRESVEGGRVRLRLQRRS